MNTSSSTRPYRMVARAKAAARTADAILAATIDLWRERALDEITLEAIAERSGVSVRTVIRRFGSRDGVIAACIEADTAGIQVERNQAAAGDMEGALEVLLGHYERDGAAVLRTLALEEKLEVARTIAETGRAEHRAWCARVFGPHLPAPDDPAYGPRMDAFVAATDLYLWRLLRLDLGRTFDQTREVFRCLVGALVAFPPRQE
jgi:AcrR family transcriptional regulator